jgi:hypothetical protein
MDATTVPTWNQSTTGTAANITATSNATLTTLSALSLPYSQLTGTPTLSYLPLSGGSMAAGASITGTAASYFFIGYPNETTNNQSIQFNSKTRMGAPYPMQFYSENGYSFANTAGTTTFLNIASTGAATYSNSINSKGLVVVGASGGYTTGDNTWINLGGGSGADNFGAINMPFADKIRLNSYWGFSFRTSNNGASGTPVEVASISTSGAATFSSSIAATSATFSGKVFLNTTTAYTSELNVQAIAANRPAIKAGYGGVTGNGYWLLGDNYTTDESLMAIGVDYSSGGLVLGSALAPSTTTSGAFISTQAQFGGYGSAIRLGTSGEIVFYNGTQNSVIAAGSAKTASVALTIAQTGAATFSSSITTGGTALFGSDVFTYNNGGIFFSGSGSYSSGIFQNGTGLNLQVSGSPALKLAYTTGAATFSSSVQAGGSSANGYFYGKYLYYNAANDPLIINSPADAGIINLTTGSTSGYVSSITVNGGYVSGGGGDANTILFKTASTERMRITSGGSVGIGTPQPVGTVGLNIYGGDVNNPAILTLESYANGGGNTGLYFRPYQAVSQANLYPAQAAIIGSDNNYSAEIQFWTKTPSAIANAMVARGKFTNDGILKIADGSGNFAGTSGSERLNVNGDIYASGNLIVSGTTFGGVTTQAYGYGHIYKGYTGSYYDVMFLNSGLAVDELTVSGGLNMVTTTAGFTVPNMTTTQKNALTKRKGMIVYDTTANLLQAWNGASWNNLW